MCCFIGAFLAGGFLLRGWRAWRLRLARARVAALAAGVVLAGGLAAWHLPHYLSRAEASERDLLAEIIAEPICRASTAP